jgi:uncharacterized membrane protein YoaT (DUF817 family)
MKAIIYKKPTIFAVFWLVALLSIAYLDSHNGTRFTFVIMIFSVFLGRKIVSNGTDLSNKQKMLLIVCSVVMAGVFMIFAYNIAVNKIINK